MSMKTIGIVASGVILLGTLTAVAFKEHLPKFGGSGSPNTTVIQTAPQLPIYPDQQFISVVETARRQYIDSRGNSIGLRERRAQELCALGFPQARAVDWTGILRSASTTSNGSGVVQLELAQGVRVSTRGSAVTDALDNTLIEPGSTIAHNLTDLRVGSRVKFSGTFFQDSTDCIRESSITAEQAMRNPNFIIRFSSITRE